MGQCAQAGHYLLLIHNGNLLTGSHKAFQQTTLCHIHGLSSLLTPEMNPLIVKL